MTDDYITRMSEQSFQKFLDEDTVLRCWFNRMSEDMQYIYRRTYFCGWADGMLKGGRLAASMGQI